ncbi:hypothetical protein [Cytophaga aurantiaca]|uniref:hypothetical protein n=1 Tax=Cytophaga aurantiaca TaxID=29530 RepID=UPI00035F043D|nr:hypothetical protein [Cytophaga aurantiaca]
MKQLVLFLILTFVLASCTDKDGVTGSTDSTDSASIANPIDSTSPTSTLIDDDSGDPYIYSDIINKAGSITLTTQPTQVYFDSLLQIPLDQLSIEEHIRIESYCGTTTKNNWIEPVYKISYQSQEGTKSGYVSQSYIACRVDTLKSQQLVTLTLSYNKLKEKFIGKICLLNRGWNIIGTSYVELDILTEGDAPYSYSYYFSFEEIESTGLDGITESFSIHTGFDACGYPSFDYMFLWNGQKLIAFPETYAIAEAGQFHQYSYWIFPADSLGKKGSILKIIEGDQYEDAPGDTQIINKDSTVIEYKWNKNSFLSATGDTILKKSRTYSVEADY